MGVLTLSSCLLKAPSPRRSTAYLRRRRAIVHLPHIDFVRLVCGPDYHIISHPNQLSQGFHSGVYILFDLCRYL